MSCFICDKSIWEQPYRTPCGCPFHEECISGFKRKTCPRCNTYIEKDLDLPGYELFTLLDDMQCKICNWKVIKQVSLTRDSIKVSFTLNHHCKICYINCSSTMKSSRKQFAFKEILFDMKPYDASLFDRGKHLYGELARPFSKYDYLYCQYCNAKVTELQDDNFASSDPVPSPVRSCCRCNNLTFETVLDRTYQKLPKCAICQNVVTQDQHFQRLCCMFVPFHYECSWKYPVCPVCGFESRVTLDIPKSDPSMQEWLNVEHQS